MSPGSAGGRWTWERSRRTARSKPPTPRSRPPAYAAPTVELFERAAALAQEDGAGSMGLVHLLAAFADVEWRAELARGVVGSPPRLAGAPG